MCGIVGYVGNRPALNIVLDGLRRLEYRGYDSAGIAVIGHTRWATHGGPTDRNAPPHLSADGRIAVIHNGIIENFSRLRAELESTGIEFVSDTDTECAAHL